MKVLVFSGAPWSTDNSFGNTFSNLFSELENVEIANIYCKYGQPDSVVVSRYFQITEKSLLQNLKNRENPPGREVFQAERADELEPQSQTIFNAARKRRWRIFFMARALIWKIGRWRSKELKDFVDSFQPDLLYLPLYYADHLLEIEQFLINYVRCPVAGHVSDDIYTLRQFSLSPLYWIDRFIKRGKIRRIVSHCQFLHVISDIQKEEYEKAFGKQCRIFRKRMDFTCTPAEKPLHTPIQFLYTGNIGAGRWESLAAVGRALEEINRDGCMGQLVIYTTTPLSNRMKKALDIPGSVKLMGSVSGEEAIRLQQEADVLVHVESLKLKGRLQVHQSFSTKIVDYLHTGNCLFAVGPKDVASIDYLRKNDAAVTACSEPEIQEKLRKLVAEPELIRAYGTKALAAGKRNHEQSVEGPRFLQDLRDCVQGNTQK